MNIIKHLGILFLLMTLLASCSKKKDTPKNNNQNEQNPTTNLTLIKSISNAVHTIDLYSASGKLEVGYNKIIAHIKTLDGQSVNNSQMTWAPTMYMGAMNHSCPYSPLSLVENTSSYFEGYIIFQMASSSPDYWEIAFNYTIAGANYTLKGEVEVIAPTRRKVVAFKGDDSVRYVLAMVEPSSPKFGVNDMIAMLYSTSDMMTFSKVNNYTIKIDPRMPDMGNHGSPKNVDLTQDAADKNYHGQVNFTMSGYWVINLQLLNAQSGVIKGEQLPPNSPTNSSIYFEVEY
ncbi:MAG: FixH family protein [Chitinophagaceae bacterium]|mgnify:FL=1|nr:FixH family protein [Chitinophagaceae bacterium]HMN31890.1 FixH family protein [Chitinophagaceae bacterium]